MRLPSLGDASRRVGDGAAGVLVVAGLVDVFGGWVAGWPRDVWWFVAAAAAWYTGRALQ